jgi:predicted HicB family RNase H-like nuclease
MGKSVNIPDLFTFEGDSVQSLKATFEAAVADYIDLCHSVHKKPRVLELV